METEELNYYLPAELIAQEPIANRGESRLLVLNRSDNSIIDDIFVNITNYLHRGDCLVINNTKVLPAKFFAKRKSGAKLEGLFIMQSGSNCWNVLFKNSSRIKKGEVLHLLDRSSNFFCSATVQEKLSEGQLLIMPDTACSAEEILNHIGFAPLPPYIKRPKPQTEAEIDFCRYQTVYAKYAGAIAAPTAGLHFTEQILEQLRQKGIAIAQVTLHVGTGTFAPIKTRRLEEHKMHSEWFSLDAANAEIINNAIRNKGRIIAVGTTTVRTLETIACRGELKPASGQTDLFITPGFKFQIVNCLITNFHLPKSTLLALVAAFAGLETIMTAYKHAIEKRYRFYSYGDCMLII